MSEIGLGQGEPVAKNFKDSEKFNEITVYSRRAACALRIHRRRTLNGQWADHNRTVGEPWRRPMLAFGSLSAHKHRTHGESRVCSVAEQSCQSSLREPIKSQHHPLQGFLPPRLSRSVQYQPDDFGPKLDTAIPQPVALDCAIEFQKCMGYNCKTCKCLVS